MNLKALPLRGLFFTHYRPGIAGNTARWLILPQLAGTLSHKEIVMITVQHLQKIAGTRSRVPLMDQLVAAFNKYAPRYGVTEKARIVQFLANVSVETGGFRHLEENMNYSAKRLRQVWPSRFKTDAQAAKYANNPQALANYVYGSRLGNRGKPNAGWLYRGSGPGQVTGYSNFLKIEKATGIPFTESPGLMREPDSGMKGALILWQSWGLNEMADKGETDAIRKRWNGGTHGLANVRKAVSRGMKLSFSGSDSPVIPEPTERDAILKRGSKGDYVRELQLNLVALGYGIAVDGDYGKGTETAVMAFQRANGLKVDGWAGPRTIDAVGRAVAERKARPKIEKAAEDAKGKATKEVEKKTGLWGWLTGLVGSGGLGIAGFAGVDWQTVAAIGGVVLVFLIILLVLRTQIVGAVKDIKSAVEGDA